MDKNISEQIEHMELEDRIHVIRQECNMPDGAKPVFPFRVRKNLDTAVARIDHDPVRPLATDMESQQRDIKLPDFAEFFSASAFH